MKNSLTHIILVLVTAGVFGLYLKSHPTFFASGFVIIAFYLISYVVKQRLKFSKTFSVRFIVLLLPILLFLFGNAYNFGFYNQLKHPFSWDTAVSFTLAFAVIFAKYAFLLSLYTFSSYFLGELLFIQRALSLERKTLVFIH